MGCGALHLPIGFPLLEVFAFVAEVLSATDGQTDLHSVALPIERERNKGVSLDVREAFQSPDLVLVEQEFPGRLGDVVVDVPVGILVNVGSVEPCLTLLDTGEGLGDLTPARTERFDLGAAQDKTGFEGFNDLVVPSGFGVLKDIRHRNEEAGDAVSGRLAQRGW